MPGVCVKIVNEEIAASGPNIMQGYFKMPEEDRVGFTADGFCRTGDLGAMTSDNGLYIKGRKKHIIRVGGYTVMPAEVEEVVVQVPGVGVCAVIGVPDKVLGEVVWAVVQPIPGQTVTEEQIIAKCKQELASFKVPRKVLFKSDMPLTRIGKVHRVELQKEVIASLQT
jgi:acyl-CoA synthetase (AMP-forming)/AMP-acid ligase II